MNLPSTLVVQSSSARCGSCGAEVSPMATHCWVAMGMRTGCGVQFSHVTTPLDLNRENVTEFRSDLIWRNYPVAERNEGL